MLQWLYAFLEDILLQLQRLTALFERIEMFLPTTTAAATAVATATATAVATVIKTFASQHYATLQCQVLCEAAISTFSCLHRLLLCNTIVEDM
jgi:ubiquitin C-terminal hydrolase